VFGEGRSIQLFRLLGIRIGASPSWFIVVGLFVFLLSGQFQDALGGSTGEAYAVALAAAVLFFLSIVFHELGHALVARRSGMAIEGIDLWFFGGIARFGRDTDSPGEEFKVAAAGPFATLLVVVACFAATAAIDGVGGAVDVATLEAGSATSAAELLLAFVGGMNAIIFVFNLVPAFPLDGGRIARAIAWKVTGNRTKGTVFAGRLGQLFGYALIGFGIYTYVATDDAFGGIWWAVLGWLIAGSAKSAVTAARVSSRLEGLTVGDVMDREPLTVPASTTLIDVEEQFFAKHGWAWIAVVDDGGRLLGVVERDRVQAAIDAGRPVLEVREVLDGDAAAWGVGTEQPLQAALGSEALRRVGAVMAVDGEGVLRGVLTVEQVQRALSPV
jgi:Zn-dependent protease